MVYVEVIIWVNTKWASTRQNWSSGFLKKRHSNQSPQLQRLARKLKFCFFASLDMILSKKRVTKGLISLRGGAGWSVPLLLATHQRQGPNATTNPCIQSHQLEPSLLIYARCGC